MGGESKVIIPKEDWLTDNKYTKDVTLEPDGTIVIRVKPPNGELEHS